LVRVDIASGNLPEAQQVGRSLGASSASLTAGIWAGQHGDLKSAARDYEQALAQGDQSGIAANNLAWIYAQQGTQLEQALALAASAVEASPQSPEVRDTLGMVHFARHEYSKSIEAFKQALALGAAQAAAAKQVAVFRAHLKKAYLLSGDIAAAGALGSTVTSDLPAR
jgi:tetratricopeptide (TPR) repeat protein